MKVLKLCGDCAYYDEKGHKCYICESIETNPKSPFFDDCPLDDVKETGWIPITYRKAMEDDGFADDVQYTLTCPLPEDGEKVLFTLNGGVFLDTVYIDVDPATGYNLYYTDSGVELMDCMAWAPLPEPYRVESEGK
mgnify:CR=1 FL=1